MTIVSTPQGDVKLLPPPVGLLRTIRFFMPFGAVRYHPPQHGADFGLVMKCGDQEVRTVKQQPPDCDERQALVNFQAHNVLIAHSLAEYLRNGFTGVFMPCVYRREKGEGLYEAGITYFGYPSVHGQESQEYPFEEAFDGEFGHGFTTMMTAFIRSMQASAKETGITLAPPVGLDVRNRSQVGALGFGFMVVGQHVLCLKTVITAQDPAWVALRSTGIKEVYHAPAVPAAIPEELLHTAKPQA